MIKPGYLYFLTHPSDPTLVKIGQTTLRPEKRLAQHNSNHEEYAGRIVKETGQKWALKSYIEVADPVYAEAVFWEILCPGPFKCPDGIEVMRIADLERVHYALGVAKQAGLRRPQKLFPDWVYAYTAWMKKRLDGRDITLVGYVKSMVSGTATFRCGNGHEWRTRALHVAEGSGCPECGIGNRTLEEIWRSANLGYLCLLTHSEKPKLIKIMLSYSSTTLEQCEGDAWKGWQIDRHRFVEDPVMAEALIWKLLGRPKPDDFEPVEVDLRIARQAFRDLMHEMYRQIASAETHQNDAASNHGPALSSKGL